MVRSVITRRPPGQTAGMASAAPALDTVVDALLADPVGTDEVRTQAPTAPGLYAWWAPPAILPRLVGPAHPTEPDVGHVPSSSG